MNIGYTYIGHERLVVIDIYIICGGIDILHITCIHNRVQRSSQVQRVYLQPAFLN
jgi:hypothetical protein